MWGSIVLTYLTEILPHDKQPCYNNKLGRIIRPAQLTEDSEFTPAQFL